MAANAGARFAVVGRSSAGASARNVNRRLSALRTVTLVDWRDAAAAVEGRDALETQWRARGAQVWSAGLTPFRSNGTWRGTAAFAPTASHENAEPVASLTYARIRPSKAAHFYMLGFPRAARRMVGPGSPMLAGIGFGDVPVRHACTFSLWPSVTELDRMVLGRSEAHGIVARRSNDEQWLSESLFARFAVVDHAGTWGGTDPLA